jgi:hypothetical protein
LIVLCFLASVSGDGRQAALATCLGKDPCNACKTASIAAIAPNRAGPVASARGASIRIERGEAARRPGTLARTRASVYYVSHQQAGRVGGAAWCACQRAERRPQGQPLKQSVAPDGAPCSATHWWRQWQRHLGGRETMLAQPELRGLSALGARIIIASVPRRIPSRRASAASVAAPSALAYAGGSSTALASKCRLDHPSGDSLDPIHTRAPVSVGAVRAKDVADASEPRSPR